MMLMLQLFVRSKSQEHAHFLSPKHRLRVQESSSQIARAIFLVFIS